MRFSCLHIPNLKHPILLWIIVLVWGNECRAQNNLLDHTFGADGILSFHPDYYQEPCKILLVNDTHYVTVSVVHDAGFLYEDVMLHRFDADGNPVAAFGNNGSLRFDFPGMARSRPVDAIVSGDTLIYVLGMGLDSASSFSKFCVAAFTLDGNIYSSFGNAGNINLNFYYNSEQPKAMAMQPDGKILITGLTYDNDTIPWEYPCVARLNTDGSPDTSFGTTGKQIYDLMNGNIIAAGMQTIPDNFSRHVGGGYFESITVLNDGRIFCGGGYHNGGYYEGLLVMLNDDGTFDTDFSIGGKMIMNYYPFSQSVDEFLIQPNGKVLALFNYTPTNSNAHSDFHLIEFDPADHGMEDNNYDLNNTFDKAKGFVRDEDGKLWITGNMIYPGNFSAYYTSDNAFLNCMWQANGFWQNYNAFEQDGKAWFTSDTLQGHQYNATDIILDGQNRLVIFGNTFKPGDPDFLSDLVIYRIKNEFPALIASPEKKISIQVFPNPASHEVHISSDISEPKTISVLDACGKKVMEKNSWDKNVKIDIRHLADGMYALQIVSDNTFHTQILIVDK